MSYDFDAEVKKHLAAFEKRRAESQHVANLSCVKCGWTRYGYRRPDRTVAEDLWSSIEDLIRHIEENGCEIVMKMQANRAAGRDPHYGLSEKEQ